MNAAAGGMKRRKFGLRADDRLAEESLQRVELVHAVVRHADAADLARLDHPGQRLGHLVRMRQEVAAVDLVQVDLLDADPRQRRVERIGEIRRARIIRDAGTDARLGRDHHFRTQ